jgi:hypothetical protein
VSRVNCLLSVTPPCTCRRGLTMVSSPFQKGYRIFAAPSGGHAPGCGRDIRRRAQGEHRAVSVINGAARRRDDAFTGPLRLRFFLQFLRTEDLQLKKPAR